MKFTCIGFDIKEWPPKNLIGTDETSWDSNDSAYQKISEQFNIMENEYQLLDIKDDHILDLVGKYIKNSNDSNLVAIELPSDIVEHNNRKHGYKTGQHNFDLSPFFLLGFDVCDINGLFSILHHPEIIDLRNQEGIIDKNNLEKALEIVQFANVIDKKHSPFAVVKLFSLKPYEYMTYS
ncbi:hypothetical protein [Metapseudomonas otitidis]|uniref:hypothetical protein n=1 Tax=Metapseudomonas otitidis TaxID=319939 RepID=UPI0013F654D0|nr:hypothetical protein [Pseudomonas otitidis]